MLRYVTITGADDRVDPSALADLSAEFPFVEWGILASKSRAGTPRYPTRGWMQRLDEAAVRFATRSDVVFARRINLSLHLCGEYAREALSGSGMFVPPTEFRRVQLNGWNPGANTAALGRLASTFNLQFILQVRDVVSIAAGIEEARAIRAAARDRIGGSASLLFDPSGGRGITSVVHPKGNPYVSVGFAGGISAENVLEVLSAIGSRDDEHWIDMESSVRTDDEFSLRKVRAVLERVAFMFPPGVKATELSPREQPADPPDPG
jgi:phosphoribosylanthranilate isomerase